MSAERLELAALPAQAWKAHGWNVGVAVFWTCLSFWLIGDLYLNLRDEGYLWYGLQALGRGEVPFRDFQSYDPGRYYWCWFWSLIFGEHVIGMRVGIALFQALGLSLGLACVRRIFGNGRWLLPAGLLLLVWMFPRFKIFEASITLAGVWSLMRLIESPDGKRFGLAGLCLGLAAFFGRNHGLYLGAANLGLFGFLAWKSRADLGARRLGIWLGGVLLGYGPMLGMLLIVPGFADAFLRELLATAARGANLPMDFPWPWAFESEGLSGWELTSAWAYQLAFVLPLLALPLGIFALLRVSSANLRQRAALVAAVLVCLPYTHHFAVRSDLPHLAQAMGPLLLVLLAVAGTAGRLWLRAGALVLLLLHGLLLAAFHHPTFKQFQPGVETPELVEFNSGDSVLMLKMNQARHLERVRDLVVKYVPEEEPLFIAPTRTTFYPLFKKASPVWWIYFLFQSTEAEQELVIERLKSGKVNWALIDEKSFSKDESFDFKNTNPIVWQHLKTDWMPIRDRIVPPGYFLFKRRP